jgi:hypothetical protein
MANFPNADAIVRQGLLQDRGPEAVDVLLVNPPTPDGALWIRTQHRVGRRTRENMVWPQVSLAQMAAILVPTYTIKIIDANAERMSWKEFETLLDKYQPKYYLTQLTAPTLQNDMYGVFLARARGAKTIAFGTHITPIPVETMTSFPALDFGLVGEPDLGLRDLIDHLEGNLNNRPEVVETLIAKHDPTINSLSTKTGRLTCTHQRLVWRKGDQIILNLPRPFIAIWMICRFRCIICCRGINTACP